MRPSLLPRWIERSARRVHFTPGRDMHGHFVAERLIGQPCPHPNWTRIGFETYVHRQYLAAEEACRGHLLNAAGRARGIDPWDFFRAGRRLSVERWGSEELRAWFGSQHVATTHRQGRPVLTYTQFREQRTAA